MTQEKALFVICFPATAGQKRSAGRCLGYDFQNGAACMLFSDEKFAVESEGETEFTEDAFLIYDQMMRAANPFSGIIQGMLSIMKLFLFMKIRKGLSHRLCTGNRLSRLREKFCGWLKKRYWLEFVVGVSSPKYLFAVFDDNH